MTNQTKQGLTAGVIVTLVVSATAGVTSGSFWLFLAVLAFSLVCVCSATWLLVLAKRDAPPHRR